MNRRLLALLLLAGCEQPPPPGAAPPPARPLEAPASATHVEIAAPASAAPATRMERILPPPRQEADVWVFESPGQLLDTYLGGAELGRLRVSGPVGAVIEVGGRAGTRFLLGPDLRRFVELRFRDGGAAAVQKRVGQGSLVTAECTADARIGRNAQLTDCVLL